DDYVRVLATAAGSPTQVYSGGGADSFVVGSVPGTLDGLAGPLTIDAGAGPNQLYVTEQGRAAGDQVALTPPSMSSAVVPFTLNYYASGGTYDRAVLLVTGAGNDTLYVLGIAFETLLFTTDGNDAVNVSSTAGTLDTLGALLVLDAGTGANA